MSTYALAEELGMSRQGVDKVLKRAVEKLRRACQEDRSLAASLEEMLLSSAIISSETVEYNWCRCTETVQHQRRLKSSIFVYLQFFVGISF